VTNKDHAGEVLVYMGKGTGLDLTKPKFWNQDSAPGGVAIKDKAEELDQFGKALSAGDFNGDGYDDLAVGVPFEDNKDEAALTVTNGGQVHIINGSGTGLTATGNKKFSQASNGITQAANEAHDQFGFTLTTGDYNNDGRGDIAIGIPGEDEPTSLEGAVMTMHGSASGLNKATHNWFDQDEIGFVGTAGDDFGLGVYGP
jgi:hypothetical protein